MKTLKISAGDFDFDTNGRMQTTEGTSKLSQDIAQYILAELSESPVYTENDVKFAVSNAILKLKNKQQNTEDIDPTNTIKEIEELYVLKDPDEPTTVYFVLNVSLEEGESITITFDPNDLANLTHLTEATL